MDINDVQKINVTWDGNKEKSTHFVFNVSYYGNSLLTKGVKDKISLLRNKYNLQLVTTEEEYLDILNKMAVDTIERHINSAVVVLTII